MRHAGDVAEALGLQGGFVPEVEVAKPMLPANPVLPGPIPPHRPLSDIAAVHRQILARLGPSPLGEDQLIRDLDMPAAVLTPALVALELEGQITRAPGGLLSRAD